MSRVTKTTTRTSTTSKKEKHNKHNKPTHHLTQDISCRYDSHLTRRMPSVSRSEEGGSGPSLDDRDIGPSGGAEGASTRAGQTASPDHPNGLSPSRPHVFADRPRTMGLTFPTASAVNDARNAVLDPTMRPRRPPDGTLGSS